MAFVNRSERKSNLSSIERSDLGPGEYIGRDLLVPKYESLAPFNSNIYRVTSLTKNNSPGPGSYAPEINHSHNDKHINASTVNMYHINPKLSPKKHLTIDLSLQNSLETGNSQLLNPILARNRTSKSLIPAMKSAITTVNKIPSIPSRMQGFGYNFTDNGHIYMVIDPDIDNKFNGTKRDCVAPGHYDICKADKILKKNYSTLVWKNMNRDNNRILHLPNENSTSPHISKIPEKKRFNKKHCNAMLKQFIARRKKYLQMSSNGINNNSNNNESFDESPVKCNNMPGPGEYFQKRDGEGICQEKNFLFGSSSKRFENEEHTWKGMCKLGPGEYFRDNKSTLNLFKTNSRVKKKIQRKGKVTKQDVIKNEDSLVGPGYYDVKLDLLPKKSGLKIGMERRFPEYECEDKSPGPGSYNCQMVLDEMKRVDNSRVVIKNEESNPLIEKENYESPGVGAYNPDVSKTIQYKVNAKSNHIQSAIAPFCSMERRFHKPWDSSRCAQVGPGSYHVKSSSISVNSTSAPFLVGNLRFSGIQKASDLGPGHYRIPNEHEWNKRTYNTLFQ